MDGSKAKRAQGAFLVCEKPPPRFKQGGGDAAAV
jgi:hypothetical protein